ncbi:glycylpeptide N-tetradecanoyltransferase [Neurospora intermedia]|uniref:Glycylpeptide N-tetradecanoyltransferase n=1 Tax=Neurospora intermedia TaxID=5142 RepID=A0ABR3D761_NEUIN
MPPTEESKPVDPAQEKQAAEALASLKEAQQPDADESGSEDEGADGTAQEAGSGSTKKKNKKKSKKKNKDKSSSTESSAEVGLTEALAQADPKSALSGLTPKQIQEFIDLNPALANELLAASGSSGTTDVMEAFKKLKIQDIITGLASSGKNRKDMASYKFWATQPVPQFDEKPAIFEEGPLKIQKVEDIPDEPIPLNLAPFRWVTMDLTDEKQMQEVEKLLYGHFVEDDEAMFRFKYSTSILKWSLMSPGWRKEWHVGIRSGDTLCAFIAAVPTEIRVRDKVIQGSEVNFLCIHKKLRGKRLAPVLIKEITRRINREGIWQAIYTGGIVLPRPVSTCRYYHRALNWQKLYEVGFSPCPSNSKPAFQVRKYALPEQTSTKGLRELQVKDLDAVHSLLERYLKRFDLTPVFNREETEHWLLHKKDSYAEQVIYSYVVEDASGKITDFFSFYLLESTVIRHPKHNSIRAAYMFYYATETAFAEPFDKGALTKRLNDLMADALILAKRHNFDVFNALSLMDNALFLEKQKFGPGDGQLHYYLFNYKANPIHGGVDKKNRLDEDNLSGVGAPTTTRKPPVPTVAETIKHPAFPTAIWNLEPDQSGLAPVAVGRGGPFNVSWEIHGEGPIKVLFIMGLGGLKSAWQRQTLYFGHQNRDKYSVLLIDNRGMGDSDKPLMRYSSSEMARDWIDILVHVGWLPAPPSSSFSSSSSAAYSSSHSGPPLPVPAERTLHVVGLSLGGMIAQELACLIPTAISSLNLCCTAAAIENTTTFAENIANRIRMLMPRPVDHSMADTARQLFPASWLEQPDNCEVPDPSTTPKCGPPNPRSPKIPRPTGPEYLKFDSNAQRYVAQEMHKRLDPARFGLKGFLLQLIAAGWHHKSAEQLQKMADEVGRERILVMHGTEDGMISVPHGRKLIKIIEPEVGLIEEGMGHAPVVERTGWYHGVLVERIRRGEGLDGRV